jgi:uroporphyrinogen decarboxylase
MTSRQRLQAVLNREIPDCVPVAPDTSNMIPARMTGKPYWDLYLYNDPPIWKAYIDCAKYFGFDSLMDGYCPISFDELGEIDHEWEEYIISKQPKRIITQKAREENGKLHWDRFVTVYDIDNPPSYILPGKIHLPETPCKWEKVEGRRIYPQGEELLAYVKGEMGEHGLVGVFCGTTKLLHSEEDIYDYYDDPGPFIEKRDVLLEASVRRFEKLMSLGCKPDFICTGGSGTLITQTPAIFRELGLPIAKKITALCKEHGIASHVHSCGPEAELVEIMAEETDLTVIDPLEIPPMGNCDLRELKKRYGEKIVMKGNLHTTKVMLRGSVQDVVDASKRAIDDAAEGGGFILSTGDQCGRDTPDENIFAMIETARTYGKY